RALAPRAGHFDDPRRQAEYRYLGGGAHVEHIPVGALLSHQPEQGFDDVEHVAEAALLLAIAEHGERLVGERLAHEPGHHHPVASVCRGPTVLNRRTTVV